MCLYDVEEKQISAALHSCKQQLDDFEKDGFIKEQPSTAEQASQLIHGSNNLVEALDGAIYVQV